MMMMHREIHTNFFQERMIKKKCFFIMCSFFFMQFDQVENPDGEPNELKVFGTCVCACGCNIMQS